MFYWRDVLYCGAITNNILYSRLQKKSELFGANLMCLTTIEISKYFLTMNSLKVF